MYACKQFIETRNTQYPLDIALDRTLKVNIHVRVSKV